VWFIELAERKSHAIRLRTYYGTYLIATDVAFLLVMTRCKVLQTVLEKAYDWKYEWEPIRDGFQLKLRTWCGKYLHANREHCRGETRPRPTTRTSRRRRIGPCGM